MKLTATRVSEIFQDCLFKEGESHEGAITLEGVVHNFGFHSERTLSYRDEIKELLSELPENFFENSGGGWSFLQACVDKHGTQWGEHLHMEQIFCLGIALGLVKELMPKELRIALPGGVPYYVVLQPSEES